MLRYRLQWILIWMAFTLAAGAWFWGFPGYNWEEHMRKRHKEVAFAIITAGVLGAWNIAAMRGKVGKKQDNGKGRRRAGPPGRHRPLPEPGAGEEE